MAKSTNLWYQRLAGCTLSLSVFVVGLANGWASPYLAQLSLRDVDGIQQLSQAETSWVASLLNVGRIAGALVSALFQDTIGRKTVLCSAGFPLMTGWICVTVANSVSWLYAGRILCGFASGMIWTSLSPHLAEISDPEIRGSLVSWNTMIQTLGVFLGNVMGPYISMKTFSYVSLIPAILFVIFFSLIPDSPYRHVIVGDLVKAEASLKWFRRRADVKKELQELQDHVNDCNVTLLERAKEFVGADNRRSATIILMLNVFIYFGSNNALVNYTEIVVTKSKINMTPSTVVIILGFCMLTAGFAATLFVDKFGRRCLLFVSTLGMSLALFLLGVHFYLLSHDFEASSLSWFPILSLVIYNLSYPFGMGIVPATLVGEIFSPRLKALAGLAMSGTSSLFAALSSGTFQPILSTMGETYAFWMFSTGMFLAVPFVYFYVPETKGKTLFELQETFSRPSK